MKITSDEDGTICQALVNLEDVQAILLTALDVMEDIREPEDGDTALVQGYSVGQRSEQWDALLSIANREVREARDALNKLSNEATIQNGDEQHV